MAADGAAAVEVLRAELARAKEQARFSNAAAEKASAELKAEQAARCQCEERISTMALELKDATIQCKFLEKDNKTREANLDKALQEAREAWSESRAAREEIRQAGEIAAGKPFLLQTKFDDPKYAPLNQMWSSPDTFLDLPKSVSDATQFFQGQEGRDAEKLFWSQFNAPTRPLPLSDKMVAVAELHRLSGLAMRSVIDHLWPKGPKPDSYFGLVQQILGAVP